MSPDLRVNLGGIELKNPVVVAAGTFGFGKEYTPFLSLSSLGALTTKTLTLKPRRGNPPPRIVETAAGILNAVGLENPGLTYFLEKVLPEIKSFQVPIIVSIAGNTLEEYVELARLLDKVGVAGLELNISCPNVEKGGIEFSREPAAAAELTRLVKEVTGLPVIVKLPPQENITFLAQKLAEAGADALSLINTLRGMAIDVTTRRPVLGSITGGLSGPALKPVALYFVWEVAKCVELPLVGMGGIFTARDALEFILAGATAVAVGTANIVYPQAAAEIIEDLEKYLEENNFKSLAEIRGLARRDTQEKMG